MKLDADELIAEARARTGLEAFGDDALREGLDRLVDSLNTEAGLSEGGSRYFANMIAGTLANRLRVEDYLARHPALLDAPVTKPTFVFGLPRTGTTLTINLLKADPARRCFLRWEAFDTVPPAAAGALGTDPRYVAEQARLDNSVKMAPHISAMHHEDADSPTECQFLMTPSFRAQVYESQAKIPSYRAWFLNTSYLPAFRYHKRMLQLLQQHNPGQWTLKNPWHPLFLDDLTTVYPDARLVMTHRDPAEVVGSQCSLIKHVRAMFTDDVDLDYLTRTTLDIFDRMIAGADAYRAKHGAGAIFDIHYADQVRDPIGVMRDLYAWLGDPFTPEAEAGMRAMLAANPQGKHGKHSYSLEEFGLTKAGVRAHFRDYTDRYGIALKD